MRLSMISLLGSLAATTLTGCHFSYEDDKTVPAQPNYAEHVLPILEHHCLLCHGQPSDRGAPTYFTLAQFDDVSASVIGAETMAGDVLDQIERSKMPPAAEWGDGLGDIDKQIITLWVNNGAPRDAAAAANPNH